MNKTGFYINWPYFDQPTRARGLGPGAQEVIGLNERICWVLLTVPSLSPQMWEL